MKREKEKLYIDAQYPYVYETHLHTSQASACARNTGAEMARACYEAGYTGIMVTDHFFYGNSCVDKTLSWQDWVEAFCAGYEDARAEGARLGLQVFFGWEACYQGTEFLIYGLDKAWLLAHPEIKDITIGEQYRLVHASGGLVVHCHPYRDEAYIPKIRIFPEYVDAVEGVNATHSCIKSRSHNKPEFDARAREYAEQYGLPMTAGSDVHSTDLLFGGMALQKKLDDVQAYVHLMKAVRGLSPAECPYRLLDGNESCKQRGDGMTVHEKE